MEGEAEIGAEEEIGGEAEAEVAGVEAAMQTGTG